MPSEEKTFTNSPILHSNNMNKFRLHACRFLFTGFLFTSTQLHAAEIGLCTARESVIFSCTLKNSKIVSICGSPDNAQSYVEYRFGNKSRLELKYSASPQTAQLMFHRGEVLYANNSEDTIWFKNGEFLYSIFMPARGGPGLEVSRHGAPVARMECKGGWSRVTREKKTMSKFINEHGTGDLSKFEQLWNNR